MTGDRGASFPLRDWIVLDRRDWSKLLPTAAVSPGQTWGLEGGIWPTLLSSSSPATHGMFSFPGLRPGTYDVEISSMRILAERLDPGRGEAVWRAPCSLLRRCGPITGRLRGLASGTRRGGSAEGQPASSLPRPAGFRSVLGITLRGPSILALDGRESPSPRCLRSARLALGYPGRLRGPRCRS
jgi:hypothetical protein